MEGHPLALPSRLILARLGVRVRLQEGTWTRHVADAQRVVQRARRDMDRVGARCARSGSRAARARFGCTAQPTVLAWRQPYVPAKRPGKRAVIGKAALRRDLRHR